MILSIYAIVFLVLANGLALLFIRRPPVAGANRFGPAPQARSFGQAFLRIFTQAFNFFGRAGRAEFWDAAVFGTLLILLLIPLAMLANSLRYHDLAYAAWATQLLIAFGLLASACRRLHDSNRRGWHWLLLLAFPLGTVAVVLWWLQAGTPEQRDQDDKLPADGVGTSAAGAPAAGTGPGLFDTLFRLEALRERQAISADDYARQKEAVLKRLG